MSSHKIKTYPIKVMIRGNKLDPTMTPWKETFDVYTNDIDKAKLECQEIIKFYNDYKRCADQPERELAEVVGFGDWDDKKSMIHVIKDDGHQNRDDDDVFEELDDSDDELDD